MTAKTKLIQVRVSAEDYETIQRNAKAADQTVSAWMRRTAMVAWQMHPPQETAVITKQKPVITKQPIRRANVMTKDGKPTLWKPGWK